MEPTKVFQLSTKLNKPVLARNLVPRTELLDRLENSRQLPVVLVSAPAGYGKTTLLRSFLEIVNWPSAWLTLDENDSDVTIFSRYFISAIQSMFPDACKKTSDLLMSDSLPSTETLADTMADNINMIDQDFFLVLDDYSYIRDMNVHNLLCRILRYPPRHIHLMVATRRDPPLPLITLRAKQQMAEIRVPDLRFSHTEATTLIKNLLGQNVDENTIHTMEEKTEGWVTGLYLAAISFRQNNLDQTNSSQQENTRSINEYLLSEVYSHIPVNVQDFLLRISVLDRFCASLCDAVNQNYNYPIPQVNGIQYIDWMQKENLFLIPLDTENNWYQLHRLFRLFLQQQLATRYTSEEITAIHSKASAWFYQNQFFEESLRHALVAGDIKAGIQVVVQYNQQSNEPEQWQRLDSLVRSFPPQIIETSPDLLFAEACIMYARFQFGKMPQVLEKVETLLANTEIDSSQKNHLQSEIAALRSYLYFWAGDYQSALVNARKALIELPRDWSYIRELIQIQMAEAMQMLGKKSTYADLIDHWGNLYKSLTNSPSDQLNEQMRLCFIHWMNADLLSLTLAADKLLLLCQELNMDSYACIGHHFLGIAHYYQNDLAGAEQHFLEAFEHRNFMNILFIIQSAFGLASVYQASRHTNKAYEVIDSANAFLVEMNDTSLIPLIQSYRAELDIAQNDNSAVDRWVANFNINLLPPMLTFYYPHFTLLKILMSQDKEESNKQLSDILDRLRKSAESSQNKLFLIRVLVSESLFHKNMGDEPSALRTLKRALNLARASRIVRPFLDIGPIIIELLHHLNPDDDFVQQICNSLADEIPSQTRANSKLVVPLTDREMKVMGLLVKRLTNKEIAEQLVISTGTVKSHTIRIYQKLNVKNRYQAAEQAFALGIVSDKG